MESTKNKISYEVNSKIKMIPKIIESLDKFCQNHYINENITRLSLIATDEAITNIIIHAYNDKPNKKINIQFEIENNNLIINLISFGVNFNPLKTKKNNKTHHNKIGGYGLILMKAFTDEIKFNYDLKKKKIS